MKRWMVILVIVFGLLALAGCGNEDIATQQPTATPAPPTATASPGPDISATSEAMTEEKKEGDAMMEKPLPNKIVAPHFIGSYPNHADVLAQSPEKVVLNFNFNLHPDSSISVARDGEEVSLGPLAISPSELSMQMPIKAGPTDGIYEVKYKACWPDGSCHEGSTAFMVESASLAGYEDRRGQPEVTISMTEEDRFDAAQIVVSPGTTVTWVNNASVGHFVNSDPHPSHNVLGELNSTNLSPGESFSYTFQEPGAWGYHCSAHVNVGMNAQILVK